MKKREFPYFYIPMSHEGLDGLVRSLQAARNEDVNFYYDCGNHRLYSDTVTIESAYQEVYNMSRQEYWEKQQKEHKNYLKELDKLSAKRKAEEQEKKENIKRKAQEIIPEEQMSIFEKVLEILYPVGFCCSTEEKVDIYFEILKELNKEDYLLEIAKNNYHKIRPRYVIEDCRLLRSIKMLSTNGYALYDELYDEEREKRAKDVQFRSAKALESIILPTSSSFGETPIKEEKPKEYALTNKKHLLD